MRNGAHQPFQPYDPAENCGFSLPLTFPPPFHIGRVWNHSPFQGKENYKGFEGIGLKRERGMKIAQSAVRMCVHAHATEAPPDLAPTFPQLPTSAENCRFRTSDDLPASGSAGGSPAPHRNRSPRRIRPGSTGGIRSQRKRRRSMAAENFAGEPDSSPRSWA